MPKRPTQQHHKCLLCGKSGHNLKGCKLPGAAQFRALRAKVRSKAGFASKDHDRKKTRLGNPRSQKGYQKKATTAYSGAKKVMKSTAAKNLRRQKRIVPAPLDVTASLQELQEAGFLDRPGQCPFCHRGSLYDNSRDKRSILYRCNDNDCRKSVSALGHGTKLPSQIGRGFNANQLCQAIKHYAYASTAPNLTATCKTLGVGLRSLTRLYHFLRDVEAAAGKKMNDKVRLAKCVEVDASKIRTLRCLNARVTF